MPLTDTQIRKIKPIGKVQKLADGQGLRLEVSKAGTKFFKYRFSLEGKDSDFTIGEYPMVSLAQARSLRDEARALVKSGVNPNDYRKQIKANKKAELEELEVLKNRMTFNELFRLWHEHNSQQWTPAYAQDIHERIENHLTPTIGSVPLDEIEPQTIIKALQQIEKKGRLETLKRARQYAGRIFKYGVGLGYCERNPVADLPNDIFLQQEKNNYFHITNIAEFQQLLKALDAYMGDLSTSTALKLAPHVFLRPAELARLEWSEVDFAANQINIAPARMKMKRAHVVPMSHQVKSILESMRVFEEQSTFVFPSPRSNFRPISEQSLNAALHRLGFKGKHTAHGFRHTASTLLNEVGFNRDHIEKQLAHESSNNIRRTYNKAEYLNERRTMMQYWSDQLDLIKSGSLTMSQRGV